jgi:tetratricopeptide (TPR) repeat protein
VANPAEYDMQALIDQLFPEPAPAFDFLEKGDVTTGAKMFGAMYRRFSAKLEKDQSFKDTFTRVIVQRAKLRGAMGMAAVERFIARLRELQATGQLTEKAISRAIRNSRTQIVLRYSDEEALEALRLAGAEAKLTLRQEGIILHLVPAHPDSYQIQAQHLAAEAQDLLQEQRGREAVDLLDAACELWPNTADLVLQVASLLANQGELKRAIHRLEEGFAHFPESWLIPYNAACYYCRLGDLEMGVRCLGRARQLNPTETTQSFATDKDLAPLRNSALPQLLGRALAAAAINQSAPAASQAAPAAPPKTTSSEWFYSADDKARLGPVTSQDLKKLIASGQITEASLISRDGKNWQPASRLKGVVWPTK